MTHSPAKPGFVPGAAGAGPSPACVLPEDENHSHPRNVAPLTWLRLSTVLTDLVRSTGRSRTTHGGTVEEAGTRGTPSAQKTATTLLGGWRNK